MGDSPGALESYRKAAAIQESAKATNPGEATLLRTHVAGDYAGMGESMMFTNRLSEAGKMQEQAKYIREGLAVFEGAAATGSKDRYVSSGIAECYFALGMAYSARADKKGSTAQEKDWHEARAWYQKSSDIWTDKRRRGSLDKSENETVERAAQGVARCDAKLTRGVATTATNQKF
jgi:hypothetical protein